MRIAYIAAATCNHGHKWISHFAKHHDVILLCEENPQSLTLYAENPEVKILPILPGAYPLRRVLRKHRAISRVRSVIAEHRTQLIHSMYAVPFSFWAHDTGFKNHIITTRGSDVLVDYRKMCEPAGSASERITAWFLRRALEGAARHARCVTSTSTGQQDAIRHLVDPEKLLLARTGVDIAEFLGIYGALRTSAKDELLILSNRGMRPVYNIGLIIDAFVRFRRNTGIPARLVTINYPSEPAYYASMMDKIAGCPHADEITVLEPRSRRELLQLYKDADLAIMAPRSDGTPVSAVEAMLARRPLIMGPLEYDRDLFNVDTVWTIRSFSAEELAEKMAEVLRLPEELIRRKAERGFIAATEHADLDKELRKIERLYDALLSRDVE